MDVEDKLGNVEVPRSLLQVQPPLGVEELQPLMVCIDV